jgi:hypothetical protein
MSLKLETTPSIDSITSIHTKAELEAYNLVQAGLNPLTEAGGKCPIPLSTDGTVSTAKTVVQVSIPPSFQVSVAPVSETSSN